MVSTCRVGTAHAGCGSLTLFAIRVFPDHPHAVWSLAPRDGDFSRRWQRIKSEFSVGIPAAAPRSESKQSKRHKGILRRRFWEHPIRDEIDSVSLGMTPAKPRHPSPSGRRGAAPPSRTRPPGRPASGAQAPALSVVGADGRAAGEGRGDAEGQVVAVLADAGRRLVLDPYVRYRDPVIHRQAPVNTS
jgi:hypothetical protein